MKCTRVAAHSSANHLHWTCQGSESYLTCVLFTSSLFFYSPGWPLSFSEPNKGATSFQRLPGDFKYSSNTEAEQKTERREGAPLLSRGLRLPIILSTCWQVGCHSVCLATQLPSSSPFNIPSLSIPLCYSLPRAVERKLLAPPGKRKRQKKGRIKRVWRKTAESLASRLFTALIWETFKSDKTDDEKVIRVKVRSWAICRCLTGLVQQEFLTLSPMFCQSGKDSAKLFRS